MKFLRLSTIAALALTMASGAVLFSTAQKVQQAESRVARLKSSVSQEEQTIRVLRAEWDYLNRPDRLEALVKNNLELVPASPESVRDDSSHLPSVRMPVIPARKPGFAGTNSIPAVYTAPEPASSIPSEPAAPVMESAPALQRPVAPLSPKDDSPRNDCQSLMNDLAPAGGEGTP